MSHKFIKNCGYIQLAAGQKDASENYCDRDALLVYAGDFESMDGLVTITHDDIKMLCLNHNESMARLAANGQVPVGKCPPIQLDHSQSAKDTVGRCVGEVYEGMHTRPDGVTVPALFAKKLRFLGAENVVKVKDGRWAELSIGADLETRLLSEVSVTPFPAAVGAALLKKGAKMNRKKMKKYLMDEKGMSAEEAEKEIQACGSDEKKLKKLSEDAEKHDKLSSGEDDDTKMASGEDDDKANLSNAEDLPESPEGGHDGGGSVGLDHSAGDESAKLSEDEDDDDAKLTGDDDDEKLSNAEDLPESETPTYSVPGANLTKKIKNAQLRAKVSKFQKLSKNFGIQLAKTQITQKLARLRSQGKVTPAEIKKIDVVRLAMSGHADAVLQSYEAREPQIHAGVYGTTKAINLASIQKDFQKASLENETRKNMSLKKSSAKKESEVSLSQTEDMLKMASTTVQGTGYDGICTLIDNGRMAEAKLAIKKELEHAKLTAGSGDESEKQIAALVKGFETIQNEFVNVLTEAAKE